MTVHFENGKTDRDRERERLRALESALLRDLEGVRIAMSSLDAKTERNTKKRPTRFVADRAAKRLARFEVYQEARRQIAEIGVDRPPRCLILPGRIPAHEIEVARNILGAEPFAIDTDPLAIAAARSAGIDGCLMDLSSVRLWNDQRKTTDPRITDGFEFVNLDTCSLVTSSLPDVASMTTRALRLSRLVAVWCSYGHEQDMDVVYESANRFASGRWMKWNQRLVRLRPEHLATIPEKISIRIVYLLERMKWKTPALNIVKVWSYSGVEKGVGAMPMFVVMFRVNRGARPMRSRPRNCWQHYRREDPIEDAEMLAELRRTVAMGFPDQLTVPYERIGDRDYRQCVIDFADKSGSKNAGRVYGVSAETVAAWKAVRTRKERTARGPVITREVR